MTGRAAALLILIVALSAGPVMAQPSSRTSFEIEDKNGKSIATFAFDSRGHHYEGLLFCQGGHRFPLRHAAAGEGAGQRGSRAVELVLVGDALGEVRD